MGQQYKKKDTINNVTQNHKKSNEQEYGIHHTSNWRMKEQLHHTKLPKSIMKMLF